MADYTCSGDWIDKDISFVPLHAISWVLRYCHTSRFVHNVFCRYGIYCSIISSRWCASGWSGGGVTESETARWFCLVCHGQMSRTYVDHTNATTNEKPETFRKVSAVQTEGLCTGVNVDKFRGSARIGSSACTAFRAMVAKSRGVNENTGVCLEKGIQTVCAVESKFEGHHIQRKLELLVQNVPWRPTRPLHFLIRSTRLRMFCLKSFSELRSTGEYLTSILRTLTGAPSGGHG